MIELLKRVKELEKQVSQFARQDSVASSRMETVTITAGEITVHNSFIAVNTGTLTDITAMNDGMLITLTMGSGTVTVNEGGNIQLNAGAACVLDSANDTLTLRYRLDTGFWLEISRSSS